MVAKAARNPNNNWDLHGKALKFDGVLSSFSRSGVRGDGLILSLGAGVRVDGFKDVLRSRRYSWWLQRCPQKQVIVSMASKVSSEAGVPVDGFKSVLRSRRYSWWLQKRPQKQALQPMASNVSPEAGVAVNGFKVWSEANVGVDEALVVPKKQALAPVSVCWPE